MNSKHQQVQHLKMEYFPLDMESFLKSYHFLAEVLQNQVKTLSGDWATS